ncbi:hypothetical protein H8E77_19820 [bacterium]|nr:hypothetical protein [bacterium]
MIPQKELRDTSIPIKSHQPSICQDIGLSVPIEIKVSNNTGAQVIEFPKQRRLSYAGEISKDVLIESLLNDKILPFQPFVYEKNAAESMLGSISINTIHSDISIFVLKEPLEVTFEVDEDIYICWNEDLKLYGCGDSQREALCELESFFGGIYDSYRNTPKSELTKDAKQLLKNFNRRILVEL